MENEPAGHGEGALLPGGQKEPVGHTEHMLEPLLLTVANRPPAHEDGAAGAGAALEGGFGVPNAGKEGELEAAHTKGQP